MALFQLDDDDDDFPPAEHAMNEPNGLLAIGGDLSPERLYRAYREGIFPWYSAHQPILWWSPDPRGVLLPADFHCSGSLRKQLRHHPYQCWINRDFKQVILACAAPRKDTDETWITPLMQAAYLKLHQQGLAHSVEIWLDDRLVGGLYGVAVGSIFCGESMFALRPNVSKMALYCLCQHWLKQGGSLIDCQMQNSHLQTLGTVEWPRRRYLQHLFLYRDAQLDARCWYRQEVTM